MSKTRWSAVKTVFDRAHELDAGRRAAYLAEACGPDRALRAEVESLLEAAADDCFLAPPDAHAIGRAIGVESDLLVPGAIVGRYELIELIAVGGMSEVHLARRADDAFDKHVAIKVIRRSLGLPHLVERFHRERQTLARLEHPNITRLLDGGTTEDGLPYLVMEHVAGLPIDRHCDEHDLPVQARLELFATVCAAVQHAHRALVVHRDLKPSNILVTDDGTVKLLDFGISRLLADDAEAPAPEATVTGLRAMTPEYASPEQIRGEPVTTATDVYSLGVVLYELLTGARPYRLGGLPRYEAERLICEVDPVPPSTAVGRSAGPGAETRTPAARLRRALRGDLDTIAATALRKDPARRYASAERLGEDVRRHLAALPIHARKDTFVYRAGKLVRRNRALAAASALATFAVVVALVGVSFGLIRARAEQRVAEDARAASQEVLFYFENALLSANPYRTGHSVTVFELIDEAERAIDSELANKPEVEAGVRLVLARTQAGLMHWPQAARHLDRAVTIFRDIRRDDRDDARLAEALTLLGRAKTHLGRPEAVALQREALDLRRRLFGPEDPRVAESTAHLGFALWASDPRDRRWAEAERHYLDALDTFDRLDLSACRDAARVTMSLGYMYAHQQRRSEAEAMYQRALELYAGLSVTEDLYEFATLSRYAELLDGEGRYAEAAALLEHYRAKMPRDVVEGKAEAITWRLARLARLQAARDHADREYRSALALRCEHLAASDGPRAAALRACATALREDEATPLPALVDVAMPLLRADGSPRPPWLVRGLRDLDAFLRDGGDAG